MLTTKELSLNIKCMRILSKIGLLPLHVNEKTGQIQVRKGRQLTQWIALGIVTQLHIFYSIFSLVLKLTKNSETFYETLSVHLLLTFPGQYGLWAGLWYFIKWPDVISALFNSCLRKKLKHRKVANRKFNLREYSLQEILTVIMPVCIFPTSGFVIAAQLLFTTWPDTVGLPLVIRLLISVAEIGIIFTWISSAYWSILMHVLFLAKISYIVQLQAQLVR